MAHLGVSVSCWIPHTVKMAPGVVDARPRMHRPLAITLCDSLHVPSRPCEVPRKGQGLWVPVIFLIGLIRVVGVILSHCPVRMRAGCHRRIVAAQVLGMNSEVAEGPRLRRTGVDPVTVRRLRAEQLQMIQQPVDFPMVYSLPGRIKCLHLLVPVPRHLSPCPLQAEMWFLHHCQVAGLKGAEAEIRSIFFSVRVIVSRSR